MNILRNHFIKASSKPIPPLPEYYIQYTSNKGYIYPYTSTTFSVFGANITDHYYDDYYNCYFIVFDNKVTSVGSYAFSERSSLTSIIIPETVTSIGKETFRQCTALTEIIIPKGVNSIQEDSFYDCSSLTSIIVEQGNTKYDSRDNCNALITTATNTLIRGCQNTTIPSSVESIGFGAFSNCKGLTSITIPDSVTSISMNAFKLCNSLISIILSNNIKCINSNMFDRCTSLTSIVIPNSVTIIGYEAFKLCESLTSITFQGTMEQWKKIKLGTDWKYKVPATVIHCTDGDVTL